MKTYGVEWGERNFEVWPRTKSRGPFYGTKEECKILAEALNTVLQDKSLQERIVKGYIITAI